MLTKGKGLKGGERRRGRPSTISGLKGFILQLVEELLRNSSPVSGLKALDPRNMINIELQ